MKARKAVILLLAAVLSLGLFAACASDTPAEPAADDQTPGAADPATEPTADAYAEFGLDENLRFAETKTITVEIYNRSNDGGSTPGDNYYTNFIKSGILEKHNIAVEYVEVPRFPEEETLATLLASSTAPDVCVTYSYPTIQTYGEMGGVTDMYPYLTEYADWFPNMYGLMGNTNIFYNMDPVDNHVWAIEAYLQDNWAVNTFVREDWLNALSIPEPTTLLEFEDMLVAFKDNADLLLGDQAGRIIPFGFSHDIRWNYRNILDGFLPDRLTDKDRYIYSFLEGMPTHPAAKQAAEVLNKWHNMGLTWSDFPLYNDATLGTVFDDLLKAGFVGAYSGNVDLPYRNGEDSITSHLHRNVGPEANYISVNPFPNDSGYVVKLASSPVDRKVFLPATNDEIMASLLYIDYISSLEVRKYLQIGDEGDTHTTDSEGRVTVIAATGEKIMNSPRNIDYTITINGLDLGDSELNAASLALGYPGTDPSYVDDSITDFINNSRPAKAVNVGAIAAESGIIAELNSKRNEMFVRAITAAPEDFSAVYDEGIQDIMQSGGTAITEERTQKWEQYYGDALNLEQ